MRIRPTASGAGVAVAAGAVVTMVLSGGTWVAGPAAASVESTVAATGVGTPPVPPGHPGPGGTPGGVLPPRPVTPPGWDPEAEAAKWRGVAQMLREGWRPRPEPRVIDEFASELSGERRVPSRRPKKSVPVAADVDGCNRAYGTASQCIPTELPPGESSLCAYLASRGYPPVRVNGSDPAGIDRDGNGVACD